MTASPDVAPRTREARIARVGVGLVRSLGATWRMRVTHDDAVKQCRAAGQPIIFTLWHGQLLPLLYQHRGERAAILISEHSDGEIIARAAERLGYRTVRGSTSRGAARALLAMARVVEEGYDLAITPDGPRGPAKSYAPGALIISQRTGAPIIAAAASASWAWRLGSWDRFLVPRPFATVRVAYSEAGYVSAPSVREVDADMQRMRGLMTTAEERAGA